MTAAGPATTREALARLAPEHDAFVGIDSDGCVFDTMESKQKRCFHPLIIKHWGLEAIAQQVRETAEFVALYSQHRGTNRFPALALTFDLLRPRPEVRAASVRLPRLEALRRFIESGVPLGEPALERATAETGDPELASVLEWSRAVNAAIAGGAADTPPFSGAREALEALARRADTACVSQTPEAALVREWRQHGLLHTVRAIAGQELGSKSDHLRLAAGGKYAPDRILMIGDAPGDYRAAQSVGARFYPILPGREAEAWERLAREAFPRFLEGAYGGAYEAERLAEFNALLPDAPPWRQA